jgi:iron complex outermembrane receptor protein
MIANFSVGVRQPDGRWEVVAFVDNAFDKHDCQNIANSSGNYGGQLVLQSYLPRDFERYAGIRATYKFD